jgi:hypothetical protein
VPFPRGVPALRWALQATAVALLAAGLLLRVMRREARHGLARGSVGLGLWSFVVSVGQGAGMMLVPAVSPACIANLPARELTASGAWLPALGAVIVHGAAMLAASGAAALVAGRLFSPRR